MKKKQICKWELGNRGHSTGLLALPFTIGVTLEYLINFLGALVFLLVA
jgi:hypothetical protein